MMLRTCVHISVDDMFSVQQNTRISRGAAQEGGGKKNWEFFVFLSFFSRWVGWWTADNRFGLIK